MSNALNLTTLNPLSTTLGGTGVSVATVNGTFTPTLTFNGLSVGMTGTFQGGYGRVGGILTFWISIILSNKGSSAGDAVIGGLPVATRAGIVNTDFTISGNNLTFVGIPQASSGGSETFVGLFTFQSGIGGLPMDDTNFANNTEIFITGTYLI